MPAFSIWWAGVLVLGWLAMRYVNWRALGAIAIVLALVVAFLVSCEPVAVPPFLVETEPTVEQTPLPDNVVIRGDTVILTRPVEIAFVRVPAGEFLMGSDQSKDAQAYDDELPQHAVNLSEFYIGKFEVTNEQYAAFVGATEHRAPSHWEDGSVPSGLADHPVVNVSWEDAVAFTGWLSEETDLPIRLPTEAEWEKACRGTDGRIYPWGDSDPDASKLNLNGDVGGTTPVGSYSPLGDSAYGAADMAGNVWEWVADWYDSGYYEHSPYADPRGAQSGTARVLRGGSWDYDSDLARCAYRNGYSPDFVFGYYGFRVGLLLPFP